MCTVSNIADGYRRKIPIDYPWCPTDVIRPWGTPSTPGVVPYPGIPKQFPVPTTPDVPREEFERLKKEVEEMKKQLKKAKQQDIDEGNPDCEMEEKVAFLKQIAKFVGVDLEDVFDQHKDKRKKVGQKT